MQVSCSACSAKYNIPDERVAGKRARMKCKKCAEAIIIDGRDLVLASEQPEPKSTKTQMASEAPPTRTSQPSFSEETTILGAKERTELAAEAKRGVAYRDEAETSPVIKMGEPGKAPAADGLFNDGDVDAAMDSLSNVLGWSAPSGSNEAELIEKELQSSPAIENEAVREHLPSHSKNEKISNTLDDSKGAEEDALPADLSTLNAPGNESTSSSLLNSEAFEDLEIDQTLKGLTAPTRTSSVPPPEKYSPPEGIAASGSAESDTTRAPQPFESLTTALDPQQSSQGQKEEAPPSQELNLRTQTPYATFTEDSGDEQASGPQKASVKVVENEQALKKSGSPLLLFFILMLVVLGLAAAYIWVEGGKGSFEQRAFRVIEQARMLVDL